MKKSLSKANLYFFITPFFLVKLSWNLALKMSRRTEKGWNQNPQISLNFLLSLLLLNGPKRQLPLQLLNHTGSKILPVTLVSTVFPLSTSAIVFYTVPLFISALLSNNLPLRHSTQGNAIVDGDGNRELSHSERRLLLSAKMQRVLDKACHGDAKRFRECSDILDELERCWAKEDSMVWRWVNQRGLRSNVFQFNTLSKSLSAFYC